MHPTRTWHTPFFEIWVHCPRFYRFVTGEKSKSFNGELRICSLGITDSRSSTIRARFPTIIECFRAPTWLSYSKIHTKTTRRNPPLSNCKPSYTSFRLRILITINGRIMPTCSTQYRPIGHRTSCGNLLTTSRTVRNIYFSQTSIWIMIIFTRSSEATGRSSPGLCRLKSVFACMANHVYWVYF